MATAEIRKWKHTCDLCKKIVFTQSDTPHKPPGWKTLSYLQEGGGHYGLPHHVTKKDLCTVCSGKDQAELVPSDAFSISLR